MLRKSSYSRWRPIAARPWWRRTLHPVGAYAAYPVWFVLQCCYFLMYGTWMHTTTDTHEFAPKVSRFARWVPPLHYEGEVREIELPQAGKHRARKG